MEGGDRPIGRVASLVPSLVGLLVGLARKQESEHLVALMDRAERGPWLVLACRRVAGK
jgi:hypothetical protein